MTDSGDQNVLDSGFLMGKLAGARKSGALRMGIDAQAEYDPGGALDRAKGYVASAFTNRPDWQRQIFDGMARNYFLDESSRALNKKPQAISRTVNRVANRFMSQQVS